MEALESQQSRNRIYSVRVQSVIEDIQSSLSKAADEYYSIGIDLHKRYESQIDNENSRKDLFQVIIGNLAISIELMLKATISQEAFIFLYKGLSDDAAIALTYPEKVENDKFISELLSSKESKTIEFKEAVSRFFKLFPEQKNEFSNYLDSLPDIRNSSVHAYIPAYNHRQFMNKVIFISMKLKEFRNQRYQIHSPYDQYEKKFIENYEQEKMKKYHDKINDAQQNARKNKKNESLIVSDTDWKKYQISCPVCKSNALLYGDCKQTDDVTEIEEEGETFLLFNEKLLFSPTSFECSVCTLKLIDVKELELAGIGINIDRSEHVDLWMRNSLGLE